MSNNELLSKFRQMMDKKKAEDPNKRASTPSPDFNNDIYQSQYSLREKSKLSGDEKTTTHSDNSTISTNQETINMCGNTGVNGSQNIQTQNGDKNVIGNLTKGRTSVFNLAKRFQNR